MQIDCEWVWTAGFNSICYYSSLESTQVAIVNICSVGYGKASSLLILKSKRVGWHQITLLFSGYQYIA